MRVGQELRSLAGVLLAGYGQHDGDNYLLEQARASAILFAARRRAVDRTGRHPGIPGEHGHGKEDGKQEGYKRFFHVVPFNRLTPRSLVRLGSFFHDSNRRVHRNN